jgi:hypothetical protein
VLTAACSGPDARPDAATIDARPPDAPQPKPDAPLSAGTSCKNAIDLSLTTSPMTLSTTLGQPLTDATCVDDSASGTGTAPELYFTFTPVTKPVDLVVDVLVDERVFVLSPFDAVLSVRTACDNKTSQIACTNLGWGEELELFAVTQPVFLLVDGTAQKNGMQAGTFDIVVKQRTVVDKDLACDPLGLTSRCADNLRCQPGTSRCVPTSAALACQEATDLTAELKAGTAHVTRTMFLYESDFYAASCAPPEPERRPEHIFKLTVEVPSLLVASTDDAKNTTFDTELFLRKGSCDSVDIACVDDIDLGAGNLRSKLTTAVDAGTYLLFVDKTSNFVSGPPGTKRTYHLTLTLTPQ